MDQKMTAINGRDILSGIYV